HIVDVCVDTGKGANTIISYLHHYLENYGIKAITVHLNADNCTGQNKNNALMQYLAWRVLTDRNRSIKISFFPEGRTNFSTCRCFGLIKRCFWKTDVGECSSTGRMADRQWYLYDRIWEFCPDNCKHKACPKPSMPKPAAVAHNLPEAQHGSAADKFSPP
uniref:DUF7869 domain-containing protein n=1 Tax=Amphimedon queenslandica TaxID=400682 RepID=A0A1X7VGY9_AMPQE